MILDIEELVHDFTDYFVSLDLAKLSPPWGNNYQTFDLTFTKCSSMFVEAVF